MASTRTAQGSLAEEISQQSALLAELKKQQADATLIEEVKKKLGDLKKTQAIQAAALNGGARDAGKKKERLLLKTPKVRLLPSSIVRLLRKLI